MIIALLVAALVIAVYKWGKYKVAALVLSAWIAEKNYDEPQAQDVQRLTKWVIDKSLHIR